MMMMMMTPGWQHILHTATNVHKLNRTESSTSTEGLKKKRLGIQCVPPSYVLDCSTNRGHANAAQFAGWWSRAVGRLAGPAAAEDTTPSCVLGWGPYEV
ncbi:hypothetical protein E2C01_021136 [Portunus trituberculatus]|uniref:Uncharacterized protein n=1 Tax=Portunus trituberculatus TaxID=210409 RepID=A0A5B7E3K1_PORTR|nr:hypothetical protein [Portunus trituberculatus]